MFEIGDKVICIDDSIAPEYFASVMKSFQYWPIKDQEYTIRDIFYNDEIVCGIVLKEMSNIPIFIPLLKRVQEPAFATWRFRKREAIKVDSFEEFTEEIMENVEEFGTVVVNLNGKPWLKINK